ncbi:MAG TPA: PD-(D/E)XK nuclease family protein [Patescibacteria group bacterium]|nr:PD-(D/E)XK nuclease family protein [Patescibacteria group bacterium]
MFKASAYKLNMFHTCAQQYKFTYIDDLAKEYKTPKPYLTMGAHVHNALHDFYQQLEIEDRTFEQLEKILRRRWLENRKGFTDREDEAKWGVKALNMLRLFAHRMDMNITPAMLEDYYDTDITENIKVIGRIDRADELEDGSLHVIDYKTGKYDTEAVSELQLILYALIVSANQKKPVTKASYLFLPTWEWHSVDITQDAAEEAIATVQEQVEHIQTEKEFVPQPNPYCKNCDFLSICPARERIALMLETEKSITATE